MTEQQIINTIVSLRKSGLSYPAIAESLQSDNIPTFGKIISWHAKSVERVYKSSFIKPDISESENDRLKSELEAVTAELNKVRQKLDKSESENDRLKADLEVVTLELNIVRQELDKVLSENKLPVLDVSSSVPDSVEGWTVVFKDPYYKVYKRIDGKLHWVHIGKVWDTDRACGKIKDYIVDKSIFNS